MLLRKITYACLVAIVTSTAITWLLFFIVHAPQRDLLMIFTSVSVLLVTLLDYRNFKRGQVLKLKFDGLIMSLLSGTQGILVVVLFSDITLLQIIWGGVVSAISFVAGVAIGHSVYCNSILCPFHFKFLVREND